MRCIIDSTKTSAGTRKLPITQDVANMFRAIIEDREAPKYEKIIDGYSGFLFVDKNGNPLVAMHWQHRLNHMVKDTMIFTGFRCLISRRMYAATHIVVIWPSQV